MKKISNLLLLIIIVISCNKIAYGNTSHVELINFFAFQNTFTIDVAEGCGNEYGSLHITPNFTETAGYPVYTYVTDAPIQFYTDFAFMENTNGVIDLVNQVYQSGDVLLGYWFYVPAPIPGESGTWQFRIGGLPKGHYEFDVKIGSVESTITFDISGYEQELTNFVITKYCSNYSLMFDYTSNSSTSWNPTYALEWCNKENIEDCEETDWINVTPGQIVPGQTLNNIVGNNGHYRIVKYYQHYYNDILLGTGPTYPICKVVIHEFEYYGMAGIQSIDVFSCPNGENVTTINATGMEPFTYQLVSVTFDGNGNVIPGSMVVISDNGYDNAFIGLEPGEHLV